MKYFKIKAMLLCSVFCFACTRDKEPVLATVESAKITATEYNNAIAGVPAVLNDYLSTENGRKQFLDSMVKERLVIAAARDEGIHKRPEIRKQIQDVKQRLRFEEKRQIEELLINEMVKDATALGDSDVEDYYNSHKNDFISPYEVKVSHILLNTEDEAARILKRIAQGESFTKLAEEYSTDKTSAAQGGDLGFFGKRQYVKDFETAAYNLAEIGDISEVVHTPLGYHIIKLTGKRAVDPKPLEDVRDEIKHTLQQDKLDMWLEKLHAEFDVNINYELLPALQENKIYSKSKGEDAEDEKE